MESQKPCLFLISSKLDLFSSSLASCILVSSRGGGAIRPGRAWLADIGDDRASAQSGVARSKGLRPRRSELCRLHGIDSVGVALEVAASESLPRLAYTCGKVGEANERTHHVDMPVGSAGQAEKQVFPTSSIFASILR